MLCLTGLSLPFKTERDRGEKRGLYRHHCGSFLWLVDLEARVLRASELTGETWALRRALRGERRR